MTYEEKLTTLFAGLDQMDVALIEPLFEQASYAAGETVIKQGTKADYLYLVVNGSAQISYKPYDGEAITVTHVDPGGLFGWSALVGSVSYTSSATAVEGLTVMRIRGLELRKLCAKHPQAGRVILDRLAGAVSSRWQDAHVQVRAILEDGMKY